MSKLHPRSKGPLWVGRGFPIHGPCACRTATAFLRSFNKEPCFFYWWQKVKARHSKKRKRRCAWFGDKNLASLGHFKSSSFYIEPPCPCKFLSFCVRNKNFIANPEKGIEGELSTLYLCILFVTRRAADFRGGSILFLTRNWPKVWFVMKASSGEMLFFCPLPQFSHLFIISFFLYILFFYPFLSLSLLLFHLLTSDPQLYIPPFNDPPRSHKSRATNKHGSHPTLLCPLGCRPCGLHLLRHGRCLVHEPSGR